VNATRKTSVTISAAGSHRPVSPRLPRNQWLVPTALIVLSLIPILGGTVRLGELTGGADITPKNERFFASPIPVVVHIVSVTGYSLLGAFQFVPALRGGRHGWHRIAGRILVPAGLLVALSGLWMALFYALPPSDGVILLILRLIFGSAMLASIILGFLAIRRRDFVRHSAWMTRAYAIALGAGTQALILIVPELLSSPPDVTSRAVLMGAAWMINLAVAESVIRRRSRLSVPASGTSGRSVEPRAGASR
jgi:cytochrome bd-type quinol oxidase subunit 2